MYFDDPGERRRFWRTDPFVAARALNNMFIHRIKYVLESNEYFLIDETLYTILMYELLYKSLNDPRFHLYTILHYTVGSL